MAEQAVELVDLSLDQDPPDSTHVPATEEEILEWFRRTRPDRYLRVKRAFEAARRVARGNGHARAW